MILVSDRICPIDIKQAKSLRTDTYPVPSPLPSRANGLKFSTVS